MDEPNAISSGQDTWAASINVTGGKIEISEHKILPINIVKVNDIN